jgi:hypothetical protein
MKLPSTNGLCKIRGKKTSGIGLAAWLAACAAVGYRRRPVPTRHLAD